jgi:hypothetical protein
VRDPEYVVFETGAVLSLRKEKAEAAGLHAVATSKVFAAGQDLTLSQGATDAVGGPVGREHRVVVEEPVEDRGRSPSVVLIGGRSAQSHRPA